MKLQKKGEIPDWYSTNALQFFMDKYSYQGETVRSRDTAVAKYLAKYAPTVYPDWWEEDEYTKGKTYEQVFFDVVWDGFAVLSTPLKANAGLPQRGLTVSCCGQHMGNSVASKAFIRGELEVLIKNSHGCSMSVSDWLAEGTVYDKDGNISAGIEPVIDDMQKSTFEINQGIELSTKALTNSSGYKNKVTIKITTSKGVKSISGTVFGEDVQRVVDLDGFKIDVDPKGKMIIMKNKDIPGVVGKVGNILGQNGINISDFRLSRGKEGTALAVILIDEKANSKVISELDNLEASIAVAYAEIQGEITAIGMSELKKGLKIEVDGIPYKIVEYQHVKPGKGAAFVRAKIKSFLNGKTIEKTFHAGDKCETPNLVQKQMQFLYDDGELLQFMDTTTYEQEGLTYEQVGDAFDWIIDGMQVDMMYFNGKAITVEPPMVVELKIIDTPPNIS